MLSSPVVVSYTAGTLYDPCRGTLRDIPLIRCAGMTLADKRGYTTVVFSRGVCVMSHPPLYNSRTISDTIFPLVDFFWFLL